MDFERHQWPRKIMTSQHEMRMANHGGGTKTLLKLTVPDIPVAPQNGNLP